MTQDKPKVSVILTSFNHAKYLRESIDSVLNQTFTDFELIIWDDASTDNSWEIIQGYADPRIKPFRNDRQRRGIYGINKAIMEVARGDYIAIHHSDDVWRRDKLEKQIDVLNHDESIGGVFSHVYAINENGGDVKNHPYAVIFSQPNMTRFEWLRHFFLYGNRLCHSSALVRRCAYLEVGGYRYGLAQLTDFDMWVRLCARYSIHVIQEALVKFRETLHKYPSYGLI